MINIRLIYLIRNLIRNCIDWDEIDIEIVGEASNSHECLICIEKNKNNENVFSYYTSMTNKNGEFINNNPFLDILNKEETNLFKDKYKDTKKVLETISYDQESNKNVYLKK